MTERDFLEEGETTTVELEIIIEDLDFTTSVEFKVYALPRVKEEEVIDYPDDEEDGETEEVVEPTPEEIEYELNQYFIS